MSEIYERIASLGNASIAYVLKQLPQFKLNRSLVYRIQLEIKKRKKAQNLYNTLSKNDPRYKEAVNICKQPNRYNGFPYCGRGRPPASHIIKRNRLIFSEITNGHIHTRGSLCGTLNMFKAKIRGRTYNWKQKKPDSIYPPASVSRILIKTFHIPLKRVMIPFDCKSNAQEFPFIIKIRHTPLCYPIKTHRNRYIIVILAARGPNSREYHFFSAYNTSEFDFKSALSAFCKNFIKIYSKVGHFSYQCHELENFMSDPLEVSNLINREQRKDERGINEIEDAKSLS